MANFPNLFVIFELHKNLHFTFSWKNLNKNINSLEAMDKAVSEWDLLVLKVELIYHVKCREVPKKVLIW